ncbi:hypothetical protein EC957_010614 [Mortierella hygrophila]|uniref:RING-type E3 ubiquitin transferase n=1 Tax=Mortierella hygrophila TaxID=979708 RepID=A0A9P6F8S8_9FUNG|nr:hypothetical protein EC957_010614 [Mortierella hygrophila]
MSDDAMQGTLTYDQDIQDLPEDDNDTGNNSNDQPGPAGPLVTLFSLNSLAASIPLTRNKTILGRVAAKCTEGAVLDSPRISGAHCEVSSRSMTDANAAIWIKDTSSNGVWVNEKKIPKGETVKIFDRDIVSFAAGPVNAKSDAPAFMLMDKRIKSATSNDTQQQQQQQPLSKRTNDDLKDESTAAESTAVDSEPEQKKQKTDDAMSAKDKEQEDSAFEQEFECSVCHEIMHKPMILQPCLHSFCRGCCKSWLKQSKVCPSCRQEVTRTKRDFKLNNLIALFLKTRPHMARDDLEEEEGGNDSDKSDLIGGERPRRRNRHYDDDDEDDEDEYDEDEDDNLLPLPAGFQGQPVTCPCCLPNNNIGFTCPDGVRLEPLPGNATYGDYIARLQPQPGHLQCPNCRKHLPVIPEAQGDIADRFRCKMCHVATCGCSALSVDERAARVGYLENYLNPFEMQVIHEYMRTHNVTVQALWQNIKTGMDNGTFYYLGTGDVPNPPPTAAAAAAAAPEPEAANDAADANAADPAGLAPAAAAAGAAAPAQDAPAMRALRVKTSDRLCHPCSRNFFGNGPIYQWRKALNDAVLPARAVGRSDCWYGRHCRTQHNITNPRHAERLNHICEKTHR